MVKEKGNRMKPTEFLADFIVRTSREDIPGEAFQKSKWPIADCLAVIFAGLLSLVSLSTDRTWNW